MLSILWQPANRLARLGAIPLTAGPSPIHRLDALAQYAGLASALYAKRDDLIPFGFGGNKIRKMELVAARAVAEGADTLVTVGSVQSNHARTTAAVAAKLGLGCTLVLTGPRQERATGNLLLDELLGADVRIVERMHERSAAVAEALTDLRRERRRPYDIPLGASTPLGALGFARAVGELVAQGLVPDVIVHASGSGGTQAGLIAGCLVYGLATRVVGVSVLYPAERLRAIVTSVAEGALALLGAPPTAIAGRVIIDERFLGPGYGIASDEARDAQRLAARLEGMFVDTTYTAKALAWLVAGAAREVAPVGQRVLFWHTGGQPALFA